jgi:addiction module HigA family antidote
MVSVPSNREPTHPGEMLVKEFLEPMHITQRQVADAIHVPYRRINELVNQKRGITPSTALRLARFFDVSPGYWLNLQARWDLYRAEKAEKTELAKIQDYHQLRESA